MNVANPCHDYPTKFFILQISGKKGKTLVVNLDQIDFIKKYYPKSELSKNDLMDWLHEQALKRDAMQDIENISSQSNKSKAQENLNPKKRLGQRQDEFENNLSKMIEQRVPKVDLKVEESKENGKSHAHQDLPYQFEEDYYSCEEEDSFYDE